MNSTLKNKSHLGPAHRRSFSTPPTTPNKEQPSRRFVPIDSEGNEIDPEGVTASEEVYGFVGWVTTIFGFAIWLIWAYLPDSLLHQIGISYYPSRYWVAAFPSWFGIAFMMIAILYWGFNLIISAPLDSYDTITDDYANEWIPDDKVDCIPPITDIPLSIVNKLLLKRPKSENLKEIK